MKTATIDTAKLKETISLIDLAGRYVELRKATADEYHGPCPWCGGTDRFRVRADFFACRQCGRTGDAINFVQEHDNVDFKEAVQRLGGDLGPGADKVKPVAKVATDKPRVWDEPYQRGKAL